MKNSKYGASPIIIMQQLKFSLLLEGYLCNISENIFGIHLWK